jgi:hypothetical protein
MTVVFVSSCEIDGAQADALIRFLREASFEVVHSPRKTSVQWGKWYESDCRETIKRAAVFVAVINQAWDSSTWMMHELNEASRLLESGKLRKLYFWNPDGIEMRAGQRHLKERLPDNLNELVNELSGVL